MYAHDLDRGLIHLPMAGARILHIEDEALIALEVESICRDNGAASVTHISELDDADQADLETFDVAMVDLMVHGRSTLDFARKLSAAGIPMVFISGHDRTEISQEFPTAQFLDKPFNAAGLTEAIVSALASRSLRGV